MTLVKYTNWAVDAGGNTIASSDYDVRDTSGAPVQIYSDAVGTPETNPSAADTSGKIEFYVNKGVYDITIGSGLSATTTRESIGGPDVAYFASRADAVAASDAELDGRSLIFDGAVWYQRSDGATDISDLSDWVPAGSADVRHFGTLTFDDSGSSVAQANATTIQAAYDYVKQGGGVLAYPEGSVIYVEDNDADGYVLKFDGDNVEHRFNGATLINTTPTTELVYKAPSALTPSGNGREWTTGNRYINGTLDNGLTVQLCANPSGEDGTKDGWAGVNTGTIVPTVADDYGRYLEVTSVVNGDGATYAIETVAGESYWLSLKVLESDPFFFVAPSESQGLSGALATAVEMNSVTDELGRVSVSFTATGSTSYIVLRTNGSATPGAVAKVRDVYCWQQRDESEVVGRCVLAPGMQYTRFENMTFQNSGHYLVGLQNGGQIGNVFDGCVFKDNYMDALDHKNNGDISRDNKLSNCTFIRNSLKETAANNSAALDLSEGWNVSGVTFEMMASNSGAGSALRFKQGDNGFGGGRGTGGHRGTAEGVLVRVIGVPNSEFIAVHLMHDSVKVSNVLSSGAYTGAKVNGSGCVISGFDFSEATDGIVVEAATYSTGAYVADAVSISDGRISASSTGVTFDGGNVTVSGVHVDAGSGTDFTVDGGDVVVLGGSSSGTTSTTINAGTLKTYGLSGVSPDLT